MRISCSRLMKFGPQLRELRIHLCQTSEESKGVRDFIQTHYVKMKQDNPKLPILIRECSGVQPKLWARYEFGKEKSVSLTNVPGEQVLKQIEGYGTANF